MTTIEPWAIQLQLPRDRAVVHLAKRGYRRYLIEIDGVSATPMQWSEVSGVPYGTLMDRLHAGWTGRALISDARGPGRRPRLITAHGETLTLAEWAERSGIGTSTILYRLRSRWSPEDAVTVKPRQWGKKQPEPLSTTDGTEVANHPTCPAAIPNAPPGRSHRHRGERCGE